MKSWLQISGAHLAENLRAVQKAAGPGTDILAVVKANAYGHGATVVSQALAAAGARWLGVSDVDEGVAVRESLGQSSTRLLVMCGMELADAPALVHSGLTPVVWTAEHVAALERAARAAGHRLSIHLELDTGMARQGAAPGPQLAGVLERLAASRWVACEGVFSHLAESEVASSPVTQAQLQQLALGLDQVAAAGIRPELLHLANTSAVDEYSTLPGLRAAARRLGARVLVRCGLALYGYCLPVEGGKGRLAPRVQPVLTWKTRIAGLRPVAAGATVGYGATFVAPRAMTLALLPVGYADGLRREASSSLGDGWVMIAGRRAPILGRVSMNLTVVDVTALPQVAVGTEVVLLGEGVTAIDHARWCHTIPYEILCGLRGHTELIE